MIPGGARYALVVLLLPLALLACKEPVIDGLPEGWAPPEQGGPWLYEAADAPPSAPPELTLITATKNGMALRLPAWLPAEGLPGGVILATRRPEAVLLSLVRAPEVALDELTLEPWLWVGIDPVSGEAVAAPEAQRHGEARVWMGLPAGDWVLVDGERAWGLSGP